MSLLPPSLTDFEVPINSTGCLLISGKYDAISLLSFQNETNPFVCFSESLFVQINLHFYAKCKIES